MGFSAHCTYHVFTIATNWSRYARQPSSKPICSCLVLLALSLYWAIAVYFVALPCGFNKMVAVNKNSHIRGRAALQALAQGESQVLAHSSKSIAYFPQSPNSIPYWEIFALQAIASPHKIYLLGVNQPRIPRFYKAMSKAMAACVQALSTPSTPRWAAHLQCARSEALARG